MQVQIFENNAMATKPNRIKDIDGNDRGAEPVTLGELAYQRLRADIVAGVLEAGKPLRLEALRQRYGLSFSPLREALMRLQSEHLVLSTALRGFSVAPLSLAEMKDAAETRILIEGEALRRSMRDGDDDWESGIVAAFHALSRQVERQAQNTGATNVDDFAAMEDRHQQFHRSLIASCGSPRLLELADQLYIETQRFRLPCLVGPISGTPRRDVAAEHKQIMDAALRRSEDAVTYLAEHYWRTADMIAETIDWPSLTPAK